MLRGIAVMRAFVLDSGIKRATLRDIPEWKWRHGSQPRRDWGRHTGTAAQITSKALE
jgi:hypothetical protein